MIRDVLFRFASPFISQKVLRGLENIPNTNEEIALSQNKVLYYIIKKISTCEMGRDLGIKANIGVNEMEDFPLTTYQDYITYIENIKDGNPHQIWQGKPLFMAETSGSAGNKKYIPISKELLRNQLSGRRNAVASVINLYGAKRILKSPPLSFGDAPIFSQFGDIKSAPISAILACQMPSWSKYFSRPSTVTRKIPLFKDRIQSIYNEIAESPPGFIVAMPAWMRDFFSSLNVEQLQTIIAANPVLNLSGTSPKPYLNYLQTVFDNTLDFVETYPTSEGFLGWQDRKSETGIRLYVNDGIYFELLYENGRTNPITKTAVGDMGELVITTCSGLFRYCIGDLISVVSLNPIRVIIIGRKSETLSVFGEHLLTSETDTVIKSACEYYKIPMFDYIVSPAPLKDNSKSHHVWMIETDEQTLPENLSAYINGELCKLNMCYRDLYNDGVLACPMIIPIKPSTILNYYKSRGRIGLQQKLPRLLKEGISFND
ncbi:MAG: GH3 auxin-responsive promoter family protein [Bacteroidota bacterium]|nr:GH3 auxin-responsive promoter family protein [Bacteroidota bacterium]